MNNGLQTPCYLINKTASLSSHLTYTFCLVLLQPTLESKQFLFLKVPCLGLICIGLIIMRRKQEEKHYLFQQANDDKSKHSGHLDQ